jgi:hypothetical protein
VWDNVGVALIVYDGVGVAVGVGVRVFGGRILEPMVVDLVQP